MARQRSTESAAGGTGQPSRWWQWLLIYPTLGVALLTAAPQWIDKIEAIANNVGGRSYADSVEQSALYKKNLTCTAFPFDWYATPNHVDVDATICDSGDLYVRALTADNKPSVYWVPLDRVTAAAGVGAGAPNAAMIAPARGMIQFFPRPAAVRSGPREQLAQQQPQQARTASVICTKFLDNRNVLRHLSTPEGCFDQVVDSFSGQVVRMTKVACRTSC